MSFEQTKFVWMNGEIVPWSRANTHVSAHGLHYGSGVFEGIRCYSTKGGPAIFRLDEHIQRLFVSAQLHGIEIPFRPNEVAAAVCQTIEANEFEACYVRPIVFCGSGTLSLDPRNCPVDVAVLAFPWPALHGDDALERGVRVTVSPWLKFDPRMMPTTAKACGQYINSILAVREAVGRGFDEALLLDAQGGVAEGAGENLFIVRDGVVRTNDDRHSILMGVTRDAVIAIARDLGYRVETGDLSLDELRLADEAFFTGTAAEVTPIREVDGLVIGDGKRGPITRRVQETFFAARSGEHHRYRSWLHFVDDCTFSGAYSSVPCI